MLPTVLIFALSLAAIGPFDAPRAPAPEPPSAAVPLDVPAAVRLALRPGDESRMLAAVNAARSARGLPALAADPKLTELARAYAREMLRRRFFGHVSPDGVSFADRLEALDVPYQLAGENLAFDCDEAHAYRSLWQSPEHRENILEARYRRVGIGVVSASAYGEVVVQEFAD